ncbi:MAG: BatA domain-containing protein [Candidatus Eisenbacteria bacterium]
MNFLNPLYLFGLAAAAIPILIHLFTRKRPREVRFPSLEFLTEVNQSEIRRLRLKQWLLLLLRTLAVAALALAMSRPALRGSTAPGGRAATTVVVLLDQSGSMSATTRDGTRFSEARRAAEDLLTTLGPQDELLLVPYDDAPHPVSPRPLADVPRLRAALQTLAPGARTTDHRAALAYAARALEESHALNRELFWLSDFQGAGFVTAEGATPPLELSGAPWIAARAYLMPFAPSATPNAALTDVALAPSEEGGALSVTARALGIPAGDLAVEVRDADGGTSLGRGFLPMPERGDGSTLVPLTRVPEHGGIAELPADALPLDDRRAFASGRTGRLRVLVREEGGPHPLRLALEAGGEGSGLDVQAVSSDELPARLVDADVVVLDDLERIGAVESQALLDWYRGGGALFVVLGTRADPAAWNGSLLTALGVGPLGGSAGATAGAAWRLTRVVPGHAVLAGFPARPGEALSSARFQTIRDLGVGRGRALLEFDRAHPALVEAPHAMVFAAPLELSASDFPVSGAFLPLVHQIVKVLGRGTAAASLAPGDRYRAPAGTGVWRIVDEDGRDVPARLEAVEGATRLVSDPLERPGLYRVSQDGKPRATFAVNPDPRESDLTARDAGALVASFPSGRAQVVRPGADLARRVREARYGRELWAWFVVLALAFLVLESVVGRWGMDAGAPLEKAS